MKIAIITSGLLPLPAAKGGAIETLIDSFVQENEKQKKFEITIYSISSREAKKIVKYQKYQFCKYVYINQISSFFIRVINKLLKKNIPINKYYQKHVTSLINKRKYDYVIVENYPELVLSLQNSKVIPYIHSDVFNKDIGKAKEILSACYKVIAVSDYIKSRVIEIDENAKNKVFTAYNSIDFKELDEITIDHYKKKSREKYNIGDNDFVYAFSGRLSKEKGPLELIKAFNKIEVPNKKLLIIGGAWYGSKKKNDYLKQLYKISDDSVIYTGYIKHSEIKEILCAVDVGVVPSNCNEAAGLSVVEFMSVGALVVASNKGGIKEYLNVDDNILIDYNQESFVDDLACALNECYKIYNSNIKKNNIEYSKKFTVQKNYRRLVEVLK